MTPRCLLTAGLLASVLTLAAPVGAMAQGATPTPPAAGGSAASGSAAMPRQPTAAQAAQQERMRTCNTQAGTNKLAGEARRTFLSDCLAGRTPAAAAPAAGAPTTQQDRMRTCNTQAGSRSLAGDARRSFMSQCLSGAAAPR
ncbi:PsiF family protein [Teichococcus aerophilus]|nr:PsiF family protein [Pseudoroseomonas aerophila]